MQQIFIDGEYEYDYECVDRVHTLYYNNSENWSSRFRGEVALRLIDDGNGLIFGEKIKNKRINYSEALHLTILLKIINSNYTFEISNKVTF